MKILQWLRPRPEVHFSFWPKWAQEVYLWCEQNADRWPYVFGGGHDSTFSPSFGLTDGRFGKGYDCSAIICAALKHAGVFPFSAPFGTHELESDLAHGIGEWVTIWVANRMIDGIPTEHCILEFPKAEAQHQFFMAYHTGGPKAGFLSTFDTSEYTARHKLAA